MRVRFTVSIASAEWSYAGGQEVEVGETYSPTEIPAAIAATWLSVGHVVRVEGPDDDPAPESARVAPPETAVRPASRPRPRGR